MEETPGACKRVEQCRRGGSGVPAKQSYRDACLFLVCTAFHSAMGLMIRGFVAFLLYSDSVIFLLGMPWMQPF